MKRSLFNLVCLSLVLTFSVACGKKSAGGGGGSSNASSNLNTGTGTVVGSTGHNELVNWLNTADTSSGMRAYFVKKSGSMSSWFETDLCKVVGVNMPYCIKPTSCLVSSTVPSGSAVDIGSTVFDNLRPKNCTLSGTFYNKATDTALREAVLGKSGRNVLIDRTTKSGSNIYTVYYSLYSGSTVLSGAAQFNTSLPAALNPVIIEENGQRTKTLFLPY